MVQIEVGCATSSRRILLDLFPSQDTRQSLTPIGVVTACRQLLLSAQGSEVMAPPAPTPPPGQEAGASAAAQNAATAAGAGATPADVVRARSVLAMVAQPPPPALDPAAASQKVAISRLKAEVNFEQERNATVLLCLFYEIRKNRKRLPSLPSLAKQTHGCLAATRGPGRRLW